MPFLIIKALHMDVDRLIYVNGKTILLSIPAGVKPKMTHLRSTSVGFCRQAPSTSPDTALLRCEETGQFVAALLLQQSAHKTNRQPRSENRTPQLKKKIR